MLFLQWFDDNPKHTLAQRLADGAAAYAARMGNPPTLILVSEADAGAVWDGAEVRVCKYVGKDNYQFGMREP